MTVTKADKLTTIALSVFKLNGQLIEWGNQFSQPHGLTSARWQVLGAIALAPQPPTIPQIGEVMGVTRQGVLKQINLLVDDGLVQALPNPAHARSPLYTPTGHGQAVFQAIHQSWREHVQAMAAGFSTADLDAAVRVLAALSTQYDAAP